ncbi:hypothetical protein LTR37_004490 [Vermiconidia calcicola]|uniref:Uncharacterized protein n=1 Tax=Vermiconidia calcicola TaxID=1690605 RepID=A0ACC3NPQ0_9PEZI|nr:hypothetical protein LTR37_004490 [Vermiconidia calcicola]
MSSQLRKILRMQQARLQLRLYYVLHLPTGNYKQGRHFRPTGGRCGECERCDLYGDEDEEAAIRRAAETAEKAWKEKEGEKEDDRGAAKAMVEALVGEARGKKYWETWLDAIVDVVVA